LVLVQEEQQVLVVQELHLQLLDHLSLEQVVAVRPLQHIIVKVLVRPVPVVVQVVLVGEAEPQDLLTLEAEAAGVHYLVLAKPLVLAQQEVRV
jgi:hypothetical protein